MGILGDIRQMFRQNILFFAFFATVFLLCAAAEWMFAKNAMKYALRQSKNIDKKHLLVAVIVSDGLSIVLSIVLNVAGWYWTYANSGLRIGELYGGLLASMLCSPVLTPLAWLVVVFGSSAAVVMNPFFFIVWLPLLCMGLLSLASPIMRAKIMWRSECRPWLKWLKLLFVVYATFWPMSLVFSPLASR